MGFSYNVNVLNQKGSPALYTDTFANRPNFGYAGRLFIANDTSAIYEDTGTAWVLIANVSSGAGTLQQVTTNGNTTNNGILVSSGGLSTNNLTVTSLTPGSVAFVGTAGLITQDNPAFFWDDTNNRLGLNTVTPSNTLDIHFAGTGASIGINNTAGNPATIVFANTGTNKWRIGNSGSNTFDVYNNALATNALSIDSSNQTNLGNYNLLASGFLLKNSGGSPIQVVGYTAFRAQSSNFGFFIDNSNTGVSAEFVLNSGTSRQYTFPNATGTIALTSDLSAYLPLSAGNSFPLTSDLTIQGGINLTKGANSYIGTTDNFALTFKTNGVGNRMFISNIGNVLINSTTDDTVNKLQVTGSGKFTGSCFFGSDVFTYVNGGIFFNGSGSFTSGIFQQSGGTLSLQTGSTPRLTISNLGITTILNLAGTGSRTVLADASGNLSAPVSDQSVKENIEPLKYGLETIMKLNAVQFEFIEKYKNYGEGLQIGAIAQEVEQVIPEAVFTTPSTGLKGINYDQLNGIYIKAIQDLNNIIDSLLKRIELLENK
jgi:hypothetical protein